MHGGEITWRMRYSCGVSPLSISPLHLPYISPTSPLYLAWRIKPRVISTVFCFSHTARGHGPGPGGGGAGRARGPVRRAARPPPTPLTRHPSQLSDSDLCLSLSLLSLVKLVSLYSVMQLAGRCILGLTHYSNTPTVHT